MQQILNSLYLPLQPATVGRGARLGCDIKGEPIAGCGREPSPACDESVQRVFRASRSSSIHLRLSRGCRGMTVAGGGKACCECTGRGIEVYVGYV